MPGEACSWTVVGHAARAGGKATDTQHSGAETGPDAPQLRTADGRVVSPRRKGVTGRRQSEPGDWWTHACPGASRTGHRHDPTSVCTTFFHHPAAVLGRGRGAEGARTTGPPPTWTEAPGPHHPRNHTESSPPCGRRAPSPGSSCGLVGGWTHCPAAHTSSSVHPPTALLSTTDAGGGRRSPPDPWKVSTVLSAFRIKKPVSEACPSPNQTNSQVKKHSGVSRHTKQPPASPPPAARG